MPVMSRRYDHNPRGSATSTVVMKSNNPFEARTRVMNSLAGLGADAPAAANPTAPAGFNWGTFGEGLVTSIGKVGVQVGGQIVTNEVNKRYGQIPGPAISPLPTTSGMRVAPAPKAWLPFAILGGAVVVGGGILMLMRKKKR